MFMSRREFLNRNALGLSFVSLSASAAPWLLRRASAAAAEADHQGHILVVVELTGGNDGLNTLIPFEDDAYHRARPEIRIREGLHRLSDQFGLHPAMVAMAELFKQGHLAIVHGVGYPNPNRSHFRSMEIWHTAHPDQTVAKEGWLGRFLDEDAAKHTGELAGVAFGEQLPQSLLARRVSVPTIQELESYGLFVEGNEDVKLKRRLIETLPRTRRKADSQTKRAPALDFLSKQAQSTYAGAKRLREAAQRFQPKAEYDGPLGLQLRQAAQVIAADLGTRIVHVSLGGFDTHANQPGMHAELLGQLSHNLAGFLRDLQETGRADDVLVMTYSEFGRRVGENGSAGTDHGAAAPLFILGENVQGGFHSEAPSLTDLGDGDQKFTTDFRSVYATVLEDWLGADAGDVLGDEFSKLPVIPGTDANG